MKYWILAVALFALPDASWARSYQFRLVASEPQSLAGSIKAVAINDLGEVAWSRSVPADVLRAKPGDLPTTLATGVPDGTRIYLDNQGRVGFEDLPVLRRGEGSVSAEVLWNFDDGTYGGSTLVSGGFFLGLPGDLWMMSRSGTYVFLGQWFLDNAQYTGNKNIFYGPGGPFALTNPATSPGDPFPFDQGNSTYGVASLAIGRNDTVAFSEGVSYSDLNCPDHSYVVRMDGFNPVALASPTNGLGCFPTTVDDVNGNGDVLFTATDSTTQDEGLYISRYLVTELAVGLGDGVYSQLHEAFFDDARNLAFSASLTTDPHGTPPGIFTGPGGLADKLVGDGDSLFGGTINNPQLGGINASGQIAFEAILTPDGADVGDLIVVRADPVPEPASAAAAGIALATLACVYRKRARDGRSSWSRARTHAGV